MISIIIPFYNEEKNLSILLKLLIQEQKKLKEKSEIIFINDGSGDNSLSELSKLQSRIIETKFKIISHRKRFGKGKALMTGFNESTGDKIIFMDADLQNDPLELGKFVKTLDKGYDFVIGWRKDRLDPLSKRLPSAIFNKLILKLFFKSTFHDINCGYKGLKRKVLEEIPLYGDNYRFLPIMAKQEGFKTIEIVIKHQPRRFGKSKYGIFRLLSGLFDTVTTYFVYRFSEKPMHFFGPVGIVIFFIGFFITVYLTVLRIFYRMQLYRRPLLTFGTLLIIVGIQFVMTGIIAELIVYLRKKNHESDSRDNNS